MRFCLIKGTVSRDFWLQIFSRIIFPQVPENNTRLISNFFKISWRYSRCTTGINDTGGKLHATGVNSTDSKIAAGINDTSGKFATGVVNFATSSTSVDNTGGKFAPAVNDVGGKLPPVSTTPVANNGNNIRLLTT
jgi:hypothetical protein